MKKKRICKIKNCDNLTDEKSGICYRCQEELPSLGIDINDIK